MHVFIVNIPSLRLLRVSSFDLYQTISFGISTLLTRSNKAGFNFLRTFLYFIKITNLHPI